MPSMTPLLRPALNAALNTSLNAASLVAPGTAGRAAFALFVRPLGRARLRPDEEPLFTEARTGRLWIDGKSVVTYAWGDGERPVLLVHGWSSRGSRLSAFVAALRERGYSPVTFDAPGHGASEGRATNILEYRRVIRALHAEHGDFEAVVAHSFGVLAALFALRDGVRTRRFVGIGGVARFDLLVEEFRAGLGLHERVVRRMRRHIEQTLFRGEPDVWRRLNATYAPAELDAPVLLFHDETDDMVPLAHSRAAAEAHGDRARLVVTRGLGHRRILADPAVVAEAVRFATDPVPAAAEETAGVRG
ncbi:alpha/beta hydrolase [Streptomyces vilmorinianum]|uniref:alpha/beta hydrolase n=1 Tax=Streptomyces vilmorinianum TaxID=3051092 RepID=UPI0020C772D5|nr:alpha/beta hydrolase [Streptomyces vilmorinianum]